MTRKDSFARGAMPVAIQKTLVGQGGVQGLDGESHRVRKQMFLSIVAQDRLDSLLGEVMALWEVALVKVRAASGRTLWGGAAAFGARGLFMGRRVAA